MGKRAGGRLTVAVVLLALLATCVGCDPNEIKTWPDVEYANHDGVSLRLDVLRRNDGLPHPGVLVLHAGGWVQGDKSGFSGLSKTLAEAGFVVFNANYRLACDPGTGPLCDYHGWDLVDDVRAALNWIRTTGAAAPYKARGKVGVFGSSAGGHLALMAGTTGTVRADVVTEWSGPAYLPQTPSEWVGTYVEKFIGCSYVACSADWQALSPRLEVSEDDAPTYLAHAVGDPLVPSSHTVGMEAALTGASVPHQVNLYPGAYHGSPPQPVFDETIAFLHQYLEPT